MTDAMQAEIERLFTENDRLQQELERLQHHASGVEAIAERHGQRVVKLEAAIRRAQQVGEIRFKTNVLAAQVSDELAGLVGPPR